MYKYAVNIMEVPEIIERSNLIIERGNLIIERIRIRRNRDPEEYEGTVFYRTFVLLAPFYNSGTDCRS